ncbi:MAG: helix-turn-helix transcriptional regulator [Rhodospirillales bacterium]|nr:helix-turn-helix transcriptional regulator [Rhodospirillales bacterium]
MSRLDGFDRILAALIDTIRSGVIQLDRRGGIVAANDCAGALLRRGEGVSDQGGCLHARAPADDARLQALLARALPRTGGPGAGGSMLVRRGLDEPPLVLHVSPVGEGGTETDTGRVAALVLVVDPGSPARIDPALVAAALDLTPVESRVAVQLAEGMTVRDIAQATGRAEHTIRWHMKNIFAKQGIGRQFELVQLVQSLAGRPQPRR